MPLLYRCALQMCTRTSTITHDNTVQASTPRARVATRHRRTGCTQVIGRKRSSSALPRPLFAAPQAHVHAGIVAQPCHRDKRFGIRGTASRAQNRVHAQKCIQRHAASLALAGMHTDRHVITHTFMRKDRQTGIHADPPTPTPTPTPMLAFAASPAVSQSGCEAETLCSCSCAVSCCSRAASLGPRIEDRAYPCAEYSLGLQPAWHFEMAEGLHLFAR